MTLKNSIRLPLQKILKKLKSISERGEPLKAAKKLKNTKEDYWRFRIGDYRAIFQIDQKTSALVLLVILTISHRKEIYKSL